MVTEYYLKNKERILQQRKEYREKNREKVAECKRLSRIKHLETCKERDHQNYLNNKERYKQQSREYYQMNKEKIKQTHKNEKQKLSKKSKENYHSNTERRRKTIIRSALETEYKRGNIKKDKCVHCGSIVDLEFHHPDYNKPKEYRVLCKKCHLEEHRKIGYKLPIKESEQCQNN